MTGHLLGAAGGVEAVATVQVTFLFDLSLFPRYLLLAFLFDVVTVDSAVCLFSHVVPFLFPYDLVHLFK